MVTVSTYCFIQYKEMNLNNGWTKEKYKTAFAHSVCVHVCVRMYACKCMCVYTCVHMYVHMCVGMCVYMRVCVSVLTLDRSSLPVLIMSSSLPGVPQTMSTCVGMG